MRPVFIRFGGILFLAALAVWLYAVLDAISSDRTQVRALSKGLWVTIVVLTFVFGAVAWLLYGRPRASGTRRPTLGSSGRTAWPARPGRAAEAPANGLFGRGGSRPAPDDDPEFLAALDRWAAQEHEKELGSSEEELRRREEQLRRDRNDDGPDGPVAPA